MSIGPRLPYHFGEFYKQRLRNAFLAELGCLPQLAANIVIFQTNALFDGYFFFGWFIARYFFGENRNFPFISNGM